jgi:hypothetical protein
MTAHLPSVGNKALATTKLIGIRMAIRRRPRHSNNPETPDLNRIQVDSSGTGLRVKLLRRTIDGLDGERASALRPFRRPRPASQVITKEGEEAPPEGHQSSWFWAKVRERYRQ